MVKKLITLLFAVFFMSASLVSALDCPHGKINDSYPGDCNLYRDSNKDGICDLSQEVNSEGVLETELNPDLNNAIKTNGTDYNLLLISIIILILYILSFFLSKKEIISKVLHRKIWNILLFISFLGVGISGVILVLRLNYGINLNPGFNLLFIHVETGIVMTVVSIFHIIWHGPYFKTLFKNIK